MYFVISNSLGRTLLIADETLKRGHFGSEQLKAGAQ
jgi:hypothetical protein